MVIVPSDYTGNDATTINSDISIWDFRREAGVAGTSATVDVRMQTGDLNPRTLIGGLYAGAVRTGTAYAALAESGGTQAQHFGLAGIVSTQTATPNVVGLWGGGNVNVNSGKAWGSNFLAWAEAGITTPKLVGCEIDVLPTAAQATSSDSGGLFINAFNRAITGPAIQIGGVSSGTFNNGILIDGLAATTASGLAPVGSASMDSLINTGSGTYNSAAIILSNNHRIRLNGTASDHGFIFNDTSNNIRIVAGSTGVVIIRNNADSGVGDMNLNSVEIDGDLNHDGSNIGFFGIAPVARASAYTPTNVTTDRSYDANSTSTAELADVLGTLIADLQAYGLLQ